MNKTNRYLKFTALLVLTALVISGCLSEPGPFADDEDDSSPAWPGGNSSTAQTGGSTSTARTGSNSSTTRAGGSSTTTRPRSSSSPARAGGSTSTAQTGGSTLPAQAGDDSKPAQGGETIGLGAEGQKIWSKAAGFLEKNRVSLIIILVICIVCTILCLTLKRKAKKLFLKRTIIILVSLGLIFTVVYFGMMKHDGNFHALFLKGEQFFKRAASKNNEAKTVYAFVAAYRLNFRSGPSISNKIIRVLPKDTRIEVLDDSELWWKIKYDNTEGYVNSKYLRKD